MGAMHADYGASARNSFTKPGERFHFAPNGIYEGFTVVAWNLTMPDRHLGDSGAFRESQELLQAAAPDPRGPGKGLLRGHSGRTGGGGHPVLRGGDARNSPMRADHERRTLLYKYCVSQMACRGHGSFRHPMSAHPATASAPHRAGGSTYVRSVTLQRRTRAHVRGAGANGDQPTAADPAEHRRAGRVLSGTKESGPGYHRQGRVPPCRGDELFSRGAAHST